MENNIEVFSSNLYTPSEKLHNHMNWWFTNFWFGIIFQTDSELDKNKQVLFNHYYEINLKSYQNKNYTLDTSSHESEVLFAFFELFPKETEDKIIFIEKFKEILKKINLKKKIQDL